MLGRAATVLTGVVSSRYGASVGGLLLAMPAIFCAGATLIEKHEIRQKKENGFDGERRGREAAGLEAAGAALGALALLAFAADFWVIVESSVVGAFATAWSAWLAVAVSAWFVRRKLHASFHTERSGLQCRAEGGDSSRETCATMDDLRPVGPLNPSCAVQSCG
jgi:hypothetical protein